MPIPAPTLFVDRSQRCLHDGAGLRFAGPQLGWQAATKKFGGDSIDPVAAVRWLQKESGSPSRQAVGVVGGHRATDAQTEAAAALGAALADAGLTVLCGGRRGVMLAVCEGVAAKGGISVGLLPGDRVGDGNPFVTIPIPTGIGLARNALIARAAICLVAIGGSYGTLSEVALALQYGKRVFGLEGAPRVEGVLHLPSVEAAITAVARVVLALDGDAALPYAARDA